MRRLPILATLAVAACGPETTSFRATDQGDGSIRDPAAAAYDLRRVDVHVWSNGGYIGTSDEPMTQVGFEIRNAGAQPVVFDSDALQLVVIGRDGVALPPTRFVALTPLGPALVPVAPGATMLLDAYFMLPVRPRVVESMRVRWVLRIADERVPVTTSFVRDDAFDVAPPPPPRAGT